MNLSAAAQDETATPSDPALSEPTESGVGESSPAAAPEEPAPADLPPDDSAGPPPESADPIKPPPEEQAQVELPPATPTPLTPRPQSAPTPPETTPRASGSSELPATTTPPPPTAEKEDEGADLGLYLDGNLIGTYGVRATHEWNRTCPEVVVDSDPSMNWSPSCSATTPLGLAMEGRLGFRFGVVGIEGFGLGAVDWSSGELSGEKPKVELPGFASNMQVGRIGGGFGGGLRLMSDGFVRFSGGVGGGVMFRHVFSNVSSLDGSSTGYTAPIIKADLSLTFGKFLNLGVLGWVEFSPEVKVTPNLSAAGGLGGFDPNDPNLPPETVAMLDAFENALGDVTVFKGAQFFIGPYLGLHFGK